MSYPTPPRKGSSNGGEDPWHKALGLLGNWALVAISAVNVYFTHFHK